MRHPLIAVPIPTPRQIPSERWKDFAARRRLLNEIRESLDRMERAWEIERDALVGMLLDGAEIERE